MTITTSSRRILNTQPTPWPTIFQNALGFLTFAFGPFTAAAIPNSSPTAAQNPTATPFFPGLQLRPRYQPCRLGIHLPICQPHPAEPNGGPRASGYRGSASVQPASVSRSRQVWTGYAVRHLVFVRHPDAYRLLA